jgi:hypothetical protein
VAPTLAIITIDNLPAHPLVVHAVVVLLPLAALGTVLMAALPALRRRFGIAVLLLAAVGIAAVPIATRTGTELKGGLGLPAPNPLIEAHEQRGNELLPYAIAFGIAVLLLVVAGRLADRERSAERSAKATAAAAVGAGAGGSGGADAETQTEAEAGADRSDATRRSDVPRTWRRIALVAAALAAFTSVAVTVQVVRVGHSGSTAVWDGVGTQPSP